MIKTKLIKWDSIVIVFLFLLLVINAVYWGSKKEGFHGDEIYSYHFVSEVEYPSINVEREGYKYLENWHAPSFYENYLTVSSEEAFDIEGTCKSILEDVHPPFFYVLLEVMCSLISQNVFSKWSGILLNIIFYTLILIVLYKLLKKLTSSKWLASFGMALYGLSVGAISTVVFIRMYMILAFFSTLLVYYNVLLWYESFDENDNSRKRMKLYLGLFVSAILGAMTQYYFLVFAFTFCAVFWMFLIIKKKYKISRDYLLTMLIALISYFFMWPEIFNDIFGGYRGKEAIGNFTSETGGIGLLKEFLSITDRQLFSGCAKYLILFLAVFLFGTIIRKCCNTIIGEKTNEGYGIQVTENIIERNFFIDVPMEIGLIIQLVISILIYIYVIAKIAPYQTDRYVFNVYPLITLVMVLAFWKVTELFQEKKLITKLVMIVLLTVTLLGYKTSGVNYLYEGTQDKFDVIQEYSDIPSIVLTTDNKRFESCTNSIYLRYSSGIYVIRTKKLELLKEMMISNSYEQVVLYMDEDIPDKEIVLEQFLEDINPKAEDKKLFNTGQSVVYALNLN